MHRMSQTTRHAAPHQGRGSSWQAECAQISRQKAKAKRWSGIKRRIAMILAVAVLSYVGVGGWLLWRSGDLSQAGEAISFWAYDLTRRVGFEVQQIRVEGADILPAMTVIKAAQIAPGDPLLQLDVHHARQRLNALPEIRDARIERHLPDQVVIIIHEREAYALWQHAGTQQWIDRDGTVLSHRTRAPHAGDIVLVGDNAPQHAASLFARLEKIPALRQAVQSAQRIGQRRWNLTLTNGMLIKLPQTPSDETWQRLAHLVNKRQLLERAIASLDLRLQDRAIVTLDDAVQHELLSHMPVAAKDI